MNYLRGETSSKKEDDSEGDEKDVRVNKYDSPSKSPRLLQKLNEIQASLMVCINVLSSCKNSFIKDVRLEPIYIDNIIYTTGINE